MSMINAEVRRAFIEAGVSEETAEAAASSVGDINHLVTKADLKDFEIKLVNWMVGAMIAQAGLVVALILGLLPMLLR